MVEIFILPQRSLITIDIFYYLPDYPLLIQEFAWQTEDIIPEIKRVKKFFIYWQDNIQADIQEILLSGLESNSYQHKFRNVAEIISL